MTKLCCRCHSEKELPQFDINRGSKDGRTGVCKECRKQSYRARYAKNQGGIRDWQKNYRKSRPKDLLVMASAASRCRKYRGKLAAMPNASEIVHAQSRVTILNRHGVSPKQYEAMHEMQGGKCAICGHTNASGRKLAIDHCHATGETRSLLCSRCNCGLGQFMDSPELLAKAIDYLNVHVAIQRIALWMALLPLRSRYGMV